MIYLMFDRIAARVSGDAAPRTNPGAGSVAVDAPT